MRRSAPALASRSMTMTPYFRAAQPQIGIDASSCFMTMAGVRSIRPSSSVSYMA